MKKLMSGFTQLVKILNDGHYHDGTSLGDTLSITRSAVWKAIKKLESYGIKVDSIKGKGYALLEPLILLNKTVIKKGLAHKNIDLMLFESIDSTNHYLKSLPNDNQIKICIAELQTQGKGRFNRQWHSPFAQNITLSCSFPFQKDVCDLAGLSLVVSLAIVKALESYHLPKPLLVKWPNDIIYDQKKLSGNLIEIQAESHGSCHAIIGIGINVNMISDEDEAISQAWASLRKITASYIDRNELCVSLIDNLIAYLTQFEKNGFTSFVEEWNTVDGLIKKEVILKNANKKISGKSLGIDKFGHLLLKLKDGSTQSFSSGDTSLLK